MDFLNQASAQITNLFRSMSVGARIVAALLLTVIVVSLAYLFNHQFAGPDAYLMGGEPIPREEINNIVGVLGKAGLTNFEVEGTRIRVPRGQEATYMAALVDNNALPGEYGSYLRQALSEAGTFGSKARQAELIKAARQKELARVISGFNGIKSAAVFYEVQEGHGFKRESKYSASVSVSTIGGKRLDPSTVATIRRIVAPAISPNMAPESVVVADMDTNYSYPATKPGEVGVGAENMYVQNKTAFEELWTDKILTQLGHIPGVIVTCNVDLDKQIEHELQKSQFDPKPVAISINEESKTSSMQSPQVAGPPGLGSQGGVPPNQPVVARAGASGATNDEESSKSTVRNVASQNLEKTVLAGMLPKRVTASIGIPSDYIEQVWQSRNESTAGGQPKMPSTSDLKTLEAELIQQYQAAVAAIIQLPDEAAPNPIKQVTVHVYDSIQREEFPEPGMADQALAWLGAHWSTLGTGLLGLVSLVMLRSMVRAIPAAESLPAPLAIDDETPDEAMAAATNDTKLPAGKSTAASRLKRREKGGPSLREELVEIVREDPDAAANVLRSWINSSSA
jgi:flagellar M-ring protein FliF